MIARVLATLVARSTALEALLALAILVAGVALEFSAGWSLIVAGAALLAPHVWPHLRRGR